MLAPKPTSSPPITPIFGCHLLKRVTKGTQDNFLRCSAVVGIKFVVLSYDATDDTPLLSTSDGSVSEVGKSTNDPVSADDSLLWFDDNRLFIPYKCKWLFK